MPTRAKIKSASPVSPKRLAWFKWYTNENCPETFLNASAAARKVYNSRGKTEEQRNLSYGSIGSENLQILAKQLAAWFEEEGLCKNYVRKKVRKLAEAKETKFFAHQGEIISQVEVEALETQRKTVDMIAKIHGMYAPEKHDHTLSGLEGVIKDLQERNQKVR